MQRNSLLDLGYVIEPKENMKDAHGLEIVAVVYKPIYIKKTKRGTYKAFRSRDDEKESSVSGLYSLIMTPTGDFIKKTTDKEEAEVG